MAWRSLRVWRGLLFLHLYILGFPTTFKLRRGVQFHASYLIMVLVELEGP